MRHAVDLIGQLGLGAFTGFERHFVKRLLRQVPDGAR
jgi:hypothetical protein